MKVASLKSTLFGEAVDSLSGFVVVAIIVNCISIFVASFPSLSTFILTAVEWADYVCAWIFLFEAGTKIYCFGWHKYIEKSWNRFDFILVVLSSPVLLMPVLDVQSFGVILTLRLARLIRLLKVFALVPARERFLEGIMRALKASLSVCFGIIFLLVFASLSGTMIFGEIAPDLFGNPFTSAWSMFKIFTIEGWFEIPALLIQTNDAVWWSLFVRLYFILFVVVGGIIGLSMLNAVCVDALVEDNTLEIEQRLDRIESLLKKLEQKILH